MRTNDLLLLAAAGVALYVYAQRNRPTSATFVPSLPWTLGGFGDIPAPPVSRRNVAIANKTVQPAFQGGTRTPSTLTDVDLAMSGFPILSGF